jgi:hypothetical protein
LVLSLNTLVFTPHRINFQRDPLLIPVYHIHRALPCWTRLFGILPVFPNSIAVETADGRVYRFVVSDRHVWLAWIAALRGFPANQ